MSDIFGDLRDWGRVIKKLEELRLDQRLDEHLPGLIRLLRYRCNWQLREAALRCVPDICDPPQDLLNVLLQIVAEEQCDLGTRLLACQAIHQSIRRRRGQGRSAEHERAVAEWAGRFLSVPQPPLLETAVKSWLVAIRMPVERLAQVPEVPVGPDLRRL